MNRRSIIGLSFLLFVFITEPVFAFTTRTWSGAGADANWETANNWDAAPSSGDQLHFGGSTQLASNNNYPTNTNFEALQFDPGAGAFVLNGNAIDLSFLFFADISNESTSLQTINFNLQLSSSLQINPSFGPILINGDISETAGSQAIEITSGSLAILSGVNTYSGGTIIDAGASLQVGNTGALGSGTVDNSGTLILGTTNLVISNVYTQYSGAALTLSANSPSTYGRITTSQAAVVDPASTINVSVGGFIPNNASLDIINTGGAGIGNVPSTVTSTDPYVQFTASDLDGNLVLTADHATSGFASVASNSNAAAIGAALDNEANPSADLTNVLNTLEFSTPAQVSAALNTLAPIVDRGIIDTNMASMNNFVGASLERAQKVLALASSGYADATGVSAGDKAQLNGLWAKQYGGYLDQGTHDAIEGYSAWNAGTAVGLDHALSENLTLGASLGYAYGRVNSDTNNASTYIDSAQGVLYAAYQGESHPYFLDAAGSFANNWYDGQRDISVVTINRIAEAEYQGQQTSLYADGGYKLDIGKNIILTPMTSLQWTHLAIGSYTESNAGDLGLMVNRQSYNTLESGLGASLSSQQKYSWGILSPEVHAKWLYDYVASDMSVTSQFTGGGAAFTSTGAAPARDGVDIGTKLSFDLKHDVSLMAGVDTQIRDNFIGVYGSVALRYKF